MSPCSKAFIGVAVVHIPETSLVRILSMFKKLNGWALLKPNIITDYSYCLQVVLKLL